MSLSESLGESLGESLARRARRPKGRVPGPQALFVRALAVAAASLVGARAASADTAPFDLQGPTLEAQVTHAGATLPIGEVPNLAAGDRLRLKADMPAGDAAHYLMVVAFLRDATDPPPKNWFFKAETWGKKAAPLVVTVPTGARQAIVLLAPQTEGDYGALVAAVSGRPGVFVRASQDLNQASRDRSRLDAFLAGVGASDRGDPAALKAVAPVLARSLVIKLNDDCFQKMPELQGACLSEGKEALVLGDASTDSLVQSLTSGSPADLAQQLSESPGAHFGYYSSYVGAAIDLVRILNSFRTAHFQYIPALATLKDDRLALLLNSPPSFETPKSVLVAALPPIAAPQPPPLRTVDPGQAYCAYRPNLVLPVEGAPLVYSTRYAHDLVLRVKLKSGQSVDAAAHADPVKGGFVADTAALKGAALDDGAEAAIHGMWGFAPFDGPRFKLRGAGAGQAWSISDADRHALAAGGAGELTLTGDATCVEKVELHGADGALIPVAWKAAAPDKLRLTVPMAKVDPGALSLAVSTYGDAKPTIVGLTAYAKASEIASLAFHAGDQSAVLTGSGLDQVAAVRLAGVPLKPDEAQPDPSQPAGAELRVVAADLQTAPATALAALPAGRALGADVELKDGRVLHVQAKVLPPRPVVALIARNVRRSQPPGPLEIRLDASQIPEDAVVTFSFRALRPAALSPKLQVEVATADGRGAVTLTPQDGVTLEDADIAVASLDLKKAFGGALFGPLQFRLVQDGGASDWQPLGKLVRAPSLTGLACDDGAKVCKLTGDRLFLLQAVAADPGFAHPTTVKPGFAGDELTVPRPAAGRLYARLRDAPDAVASVEVSASDLAAARPAGGRN